MKLENLKKGMIVKNYKELCSILELDVRTGGARKNQLEWIEDYIGYDKEGHKFIIKDIHDDIEIIPMKTRGGDTSDNTHIKYIEKLILDMLVQKEECGEIFLSKTKLFEALDMVNINYGYCSRRTEKLSKLTNIHEMNAKEWFTSTSGMLERSLNKALNRLKNQSLIFWNKVITVYEVAPVIRLAETERNIYVDSTGEETEEFKANIQSTIKDTTRAATKEEVQQIIRAEKEVMESMGCEGKQQVMAQGKWSEFQKRVTDITLKNMNIGRYWQSYSIIYNHDHVKEGADKLDKKLLPYEDRDEYKSLLNMAILNNTSSNSLKRHERAFKEDLPNDDKRYGVNQRRSDLTYLEDSSVLGENMIKRSASDIKDGVKKINPYK